MVAIMAVRMVMPAVSKTSIERPISSIPRDVNLGSPGGTLPAMEPHPTRNTSADNH